MSVALTSVIVSRYPCCKGRVRLTVHGDIAEAYGRTCPGCGAAWAIERVEVKGPGVSLGGNTAGRRRIDRLDWREQVTTPVGVVGRALTWLAKRTGARRPRFRRVYA